MVKNLGDQVEEVVPHGTDQSRNDAFVNCERIHPAIRRTAERTNNWTNQLFGLAGPAHVLGFSDEFPVPETGRTTKLARGGGVNFDLETGKLSVNPKYVINPRLISNN